MKIQTFHQKIFQSICMGNIQLSEMKYNETVRLMFNDVDTFIKTKQYSMNNMDDLCWVLTNKMKFNTSKGGKEKQCCIHRWLILHLTLEQSLRIYMLVRWEHNKSFTKSKKVVVIIHHFNIIIYYKLTITLSFVWIKDTAIGWVPSKVLVALSFGKLLKCVSNTDISFVVCSSHGVFRQFLEW